MLDEYFALFVTVLLLGVNIFFCWEAFLRMKKVDFLFHFAISLLLSGGIWYMVCHITEKVLK